MNASPTDPARTLKKKSTLRLVAFGGVATLVALVVAASLWISISSLMEKMRLHRGVVQIIEIVKLAHDNPRPIEASKETDLLAILDHYGSIKVLNGEDGLKTLTNPWNGSLTASVIQGGIAIRTFVPVNACRRLVGMLVNDFPDLNMGQINVASDALRRIYNGRSQGRISDTELATGCGRAGQTDITLAFGTH